VTTVGVVGAGTASAELEAAAEEVGRLLGARGCTVVTGGLGGVMAAASRGASSAGAVVVGLLPGLDRGAANPWIGVALPTGLGELRNGLIVRAAEGLIAVGGEYGTLSEVALALKAGKPVVGLDFGFEVAGVQVASSPAEAVALLLDGAA
jgi:uncharacterized protein (TIGR00725 family)